MTREVDFELVRRLCSRNAALVDPAFDTLYRKYRDRVYSSAYRILRDPALAADVTQETFLTVLRKASKFDFRSAFSSWLYRVAVNLSIDARRKRGRHRPLSLGDPEVSAWAESADRRKEPPPGPLAAAAASELAEIVEKAVADLNPKLGVVVVLRYVEGLGYEEIAEILEVPLGTVKSRLNRAHAALEGELASVLTRYTRTEGRDPT